MQHVFIVGSKGFGNYGGYETFVDKLAEHHQDNKRIKYHVACKSTENGEFIHYSARGFNVKVPNIGPVQAIYYDVIALYRCINYIKRNRIAHPIVYVLACRIGPFARFFQRKIHLLGGKFLVNPDGNEWRRAKWSAPVQKYWKISERMMVKYSDLLVCDSKNIEIYIHKNYCKYHPKTTFIAYGADTTLSNLTGNDRIYKEWLTEKGLRPKEYYLAVGRFVPENNYETMLSEFMRSNTKKDFALITNVNNKFLEQLEEKTHFNNDSRIKFVGTVYNQELLKKIRENAYGYFHGHEVGGTNPSLLEALGSTALNLLLDVGFNKEVAEGAAVYWNKKSGNLSALIDYADSLSEEKIKELGDAAKLRINNFYSWNLIAKAYENLFLSF